MQIGNERVVSRTVDRAGIDEGLRRHMVRVYNYMTLGLALTGAWVDKDKGLLSLITPEMGGSSDLCALLEPGEPVILMGPTGAPTA